MHKRLPNFSIDNRAYFYTLKLMPVKVWFFTVQLWLPNDSSLLSAISAVLLRSIPALQSAGKLHKCKLPYLITSPGDKVILELVKGFTAFVGVIQCISNSIIYSSLCIVRNCTADTPITSSSLFAQRVQRATRIAMREWRHAIHYVYAFPIPTMLYYLWF